MNESILGFLKRDVRPHMAKIVNHVCEIGSLNVNGSAKQMLHRSPEEGSTWIGIDRVEGRGVDVVADAKEWLADKPEMFDIVVSCETYEHDPKWWLTNEVARNAVKRGGLYVVTVPGFAFPFHDFGGDYYRFTEMAFTSVMFEGFQVLHLRTATPRPGFPTVMGVARKPV
jgi:hypothetical protein